jgi:hypothetical protein
MKRRPRRRVKVHVVNRDELASAIRREMGMSPVAADQLELAIADLGSTGFTSEGIRAHLRGEKAASAGVDDQLTAAAGAGRDAGARRRSKRHG